MINVTFELLSNVEYHAELDEPPSESWPETTSTSYRIEIRTDEEIAEGSYESEHSHSPLQNVVQMDTKPRHLNHIDSCLAPDGNCAWSDKIDGGSHAESIHGCLRWSQALLCDCPCLAKVSA